jgi:holo-[acyl-carrier protein] synthase
VQDIYLGTDICQISRIQSAYDKYGDKFSTKTFTNNEITYSERSKPKKYERFAVRFATKEAVSKALGVGVNKMGWNKGINWKDVELVNAPDGSSDIHLSGIAKTLSDAKGIKNWKVSVSHMGDYSVSTVLGIAD